MESLPASEAYKILDNGEDVAAMLEAIKALFVDETEQKQLPAKACAGLCLILEHCQARLARPE